MDAAPIFLGIKITLPKIIQHPPRESARACVKDKPASITASATRRPWLSPTARRGGLRGAGGISIDARIVANIERGFRPKTRAAAVVPQGASRGQAPRPQLR